MAERANLVGKTVRLADHWCTGEERDARFVVVEDNGDRLFIQLICDLPIRPVETVWPTMIRVAE